jgi:GNAT superfamily N-acetyltransferase
VRIDQVGYDHPDAAALIAEVQQEYVVRYGGPDGTPVDPAEFAPPHGLFLVGYVDHLPVASGGWRAFPGAPWAGPDAEIKRMYVAKRARGEGYARAILAELERTARAAGFRRLILETGSKQPEAVELYRSSGYVDIQPFGHYANAPLSIHLGKALLPAYRPARFDSGRRYRGR